MYAFNKKFEGQNVKVFLPKKFNGKSEIFLQTATQEELEHVYEVIGNKTHVIIELPSELKKLNKSKVAAEKEIIRIDKLIAIKSKAIKVIENKLDKLDSEKDGVKIENLNNQAVDLLKDLEKTEDELKVTKQKLIDIELDLDKTE